MYYLALCLHKIEYSDPIYEFCLLKSTSNYQWECTKDNMFCVNILDKSTIVFVKSFELLFSESQFGNLDSLPILFLHSNIQTKFVSAVEANYKQERYNELVLLKIKSLVKSSTTSMCKACIKNNRNRENCAFVLALSLKTYLNNVKLS